jgi:hypothetical protein
MLVIVGETREGYMAHLNCETGADNCIVADVDSAENDISYCAGCHLDIPEEVCGSFEEVEDGMETENKPYAAGGYDPPTWQFDGIEWRMTS